MTTTTSMGSNVNRIQHVLHGEMLTLLSSARRARWIAWNENDFDIKRVMNESVGEKRREERERMRLKWHRQLAIWIVCLHAYICFKCAALSRNTMATATEEVKEAKEEEIAARQQFFIEISDISG